ncbi:MAG: ATP-binding protein, partial [Fidelibacterota bacterium]
ITVSYPASFQLVAATNPCPCGYAADPRNECTCSTQSIQKYMGRISGPLLDRIDLHVEVPAVDFTDLSDRRLGERSEAIRARVQKAREIQLERFREVDGRFCNAHMETQEIRRFCRIDEPGEKLLKNAMEKLGLSARAYDRILKVSRTIADLDRSAQIGPQHLGEGIQYRTLDRQLWV